jgi:hypothetical protein
MSEFRTRPAKTNFVHSTVFVHVLIYSLDFSLKHVGYYHDYRGPQSAAADIDA